MMPNPFGTSGPLDPLNISGQFSAGGGPLDAFNQGASGINPQQTLSPTQRMFMAKALMGMKLPQMQAPMLDLGNVQGNLPGGGVSSRYGVV